MNARKVFLDSDVVISAAISDRGAARLLIANAHKIDFCISNLSVKEISAAGAGLSLDPKTLSVLIDKIRIIKINRTGASLKKAYGKYVTDENDAHVVAGAVLAKTKYLLTYNHKHFREDLVRSEFGIILMRPGSFLQFIRIRNRDGL